MSMIERWVVVDTETTGMNSGGGNIAEGHKVIEIGAIELIDRQRTGKELQHYLNPERAIDEQATKVHGYRLEDLRDKPRFMEIADEFVEFIRGATLIAHNASFDISFLNAELRSTGYPLIETLCDNNIIDSLATARDLWPGQRNNLDALCKRYEIDNSNRSHHGALLDANLLADVYLAMTGGQNNLFAEGQSLTGAAQGSHEQQSVATQEHQVAVILASVEDLAAHEALLDKLDKSGNTGCLWRRLDST